MRLHKGSKHVLFKLDQEPATTSAPTATTVAAATATAAAVALDKGIAIGTPKKFTLIKPPLDKVVGGGKRPLSSSAVAGSNNHESEDVDNRVI